MDQQALDNVDAPKDFDIKSAMGEIRAERSKIGIQFQANQKLLSLIDDYAEKHHLTRAASVRELIMLGGKAISVFGDVPEEEQEK